MDFSSELYHHGIKGMKWGVRRTPEQLGHKSKSNTTKVKKAVSKNSKDSKQKKSSVLAKKKQQSEQKKAAALAKKKQKILDSPTLLFKNRKMFTKSEIDEAMKKFEWEKKLYSYSSESRKRGKDIANDALDYVDTAIRAYNTGAKVFNAYAEGTKKGERLPIVSNGDKKKNKDKGKSSIKKKNKKKATVLEKLADYVSDLDDDDD